MSLDLSKLEKPRHKGNKIIARCPACAESGADSSSEHLFINSDGKFGCCLFQGADGDQHRKRIFELVGIADEPKNPSQWKALPCAPNNAPQPVLKHYKNGNPSSHWVYTTQSGEIAGIVARFDLPNNKKETLPLTWCQDQYGNNRWQWKALAEPRPLYGLPFKSDLIVIVEGEKCADAVTAAGFTATTWQGGSGAVQKSDFSTLKGKSVILWPDNDQPGFRAIAQVKKILSQLDCEIRQIQPLESWPIAFDAADMDPINIQKTINNASEPIFEEPPSDIFNEETNQPNNRIADLPFRMLGMGDGLMHYMPDNGQHVVSLTPAAHTKLNLLQLCPLNKWEETFPASKGCDWDAVSNALIQVSQSLPRFDPRSIRGRGCWIDENDVIYHAGNKLSVNGEITEIKNYQSQYIYEAGLSIKIDTHDAAKNVESAKLLELCESLSWDQPLFGKFLAGWIALAPICGALLWRPHIWVSGSSGSGKTWIMGNIVNPMLGKSAIFVQGNTSEAGIRGQIGCDALPVIFDEAESENQRGSSRMESVMELSRQASSESGAAIVKGTQQGGSVIYMVRSMFCFSSIGVAAVKKADTSRITPLNLRKSDSIEQFENVKSIWQNTTADPNFCAKIRTRSIRNAKNIRFNADVFSQAAVNFTGDKRSADQIGTLLAGAFSLVSSKIITKTAAFEWLNRQNWSGFRVDSVDSDENQCLSHLFSSIIRIEKQGWGENITVDEAIQRVILDDQNQFERLALLRNGIKIDQNCIFIANNHQGLERFYRETPWSGAKWKGQLVRVPGASIPSAATRFGNSVIQRSVCLPFSVTGV